MTVRDLIPWHRRRNATARRNDEVSPLLALHREMNRVFDNFFRGVELMPFGSDRLLDPGMGWPDIEVSETDKAVKVIAELPGLDEKDLGVELANGVLTISGEKKSESEDRSRLFSERYYGRFERRIPVDDVEQDNVAASFKNGVLTVILPKSPRAQQKVKRIAINGR